MRMSSGVASLLMSILASGMAMALKIASPTIRMRSVKQTHKLPAARRRPPTNQKGADLDQHGLARLVEGRHTYLDQPLLRTRLRRPYFQHLSLQRQLIARPHWPWPAELLEPEPDDSAGGLQVAVRE